MVKISADYFSKGGSSCVQKHQAMDPAIGPPKKAITCNHMRVHYSWCKPGTYPLVNVYITVENHPF